MDKKAKNKGGIFKGKLHKDGGIPLVVPETGQPIEVEGDEPLIPSEALDNSVVKKRSGSNIQILHQINKENGAKGMDEKAEKAHSGDAIICRRSAYDNKKRTYIGTDKQIVSAINQSNGCRVIEKGAKAIEPDGSITQYKKGGNISEITNRWDKKKRHIQELANNMRSLKWNLTRDLKSENEKEFLTALAISLMLKTSERVGNDESASNGHHGITNFKKKHIKIDGSKVNLKYVGKSGVEHDKTFTDKVLADYLKKAIKNSPNRYIFCTSNGFRIKNDRINRYLSDFNVSAKDLRGHNANGWIIEKLEKVDIPDTERERKRVFNSAVKKVAQKIGHGTATLKKHYMMPELADNYIFDAEIIDVKKAGIYASGGELGAESLEKRVINRLNTENKITVKELSEIIGKEPNYPNQYVGGLKLQKCFLINYYRLIK
jgi:DNA topoisomerase-1